MAAGGQSLDGCFRVLDMPMVPWLMWPGDPPIITNLENCLDSSPSQKDRVIETQMYISIPSESLSHASDFLTCPQVFTLILILYQDLKLNMSLDEIMPSRPILFRYHLSWLVLSLLTPPLKMKTCKSSVRVFFILPTVVQLLSCVQLFDIPWTAAHWASLSFTISWSFLKVMSIELVMLSNHLILCCPFLLLPSIVPSIRVFSNESVLHIRWPKYWSFSFSISPSSEYSGLISFRIDWFDLAF